MNYEDMARSSSSSSGSPEVITSSMSLFLRQIDTVYEKVRAEFVIPSVPATVGPPKSRHLAQKYRSRGFEFMFKASKENKKPPEALELITRSIALSLENSREIARGYADRSMVFFEEGQFEQCLFDINRALKNKRCPTPVKSILLDRKKQCLLQIKESLADCETETSYTIEGNETDPIDNFSDKPSVRWAEKLDNARIPNTSSKIEIRYDEIWGRHIVASKDIETGDILSCEEFFSFGVPPDGRYVFNYQTKETTLSKWDECNLGYYDHCSHCAKRCKGLIPCPSCTAFLFCSEECRRLAYDSYHRTECRMGALYWLGDRVCTLPYFLAVRTLLVGTKQGATLGELMNRLTIQDIFEARLDPLNGPFANDYEALLGLSTTVDQSLIKSRMEHAVQTVIVLRSLGFFKEVSEHLPREEREAERLSYPELFVMALLLNHFNTEKMYEYLEPKVVNGEEKGLLFPATRIILGTLVLHALVNHACDSNADVFVSKRQQVLYAKRPIEKGKQITISYYGEPYWEPIKGGIPGKLQLPFTCRCDACTHEWPSIVDLHDGSEFSMKLTAGTDESVLIHTLIQVAAPILKPKRRLRLSEIREILIKFLTVAHKHIERPSSPLISLDYHLSLYTRLLYDEVVQKDDHIVDLADGLECMDRPNIEGKVVDCILAVSNEFSFMSIEYVRRTRHINL